ncbi:MAG: energy transducer TonB [Tannerellaceae bacterium]|jgi:hypothetical protein|nr:energy transducer TonB [Tannerellaceae bacterium]
MKFKEYISGSRRGKEAHHIERKAMKDPFLSEALEGYDMLDEKVNFEMRMWEMETGIKRKTRKTRKRTSFAEIFSVAASLLLLAGLSVYFLMYGNPVSDRGMIVYSENTSVEIVQQEPKPLAVSRQLIIPEPEPFIDIPTEGSPIPIPGKKAYEQYLKESLFIPTFDKCGNAKGKVVVAFKVNAKGRPYDLAVKKSLCPIADQEALRVVKEGPNWTLGDKIVNVAIAF